MTRKIECDGCGNQINDTRSGQLGWGTYGVKIDRAGEISITFGGDVCPGCVRQLAEKANPARWPRAAASTDKAEGREG